MGYMGEPTTLDIAVDQEDPYCFREEFFDTFGTFESTKSIRSFRTWKLGDKIKYKHTDGSSHNQSDDTSDKSVAQLIVQLSSFPSNPTSWSWLSIFSNIDFLLVLFVVFDEFLIPD